MGCLKEYSDDFLGYVHKDKISVFSLLLLRILSFIKGRKINLHIGVNPSEKALVEESKNIPKPK